MPPVGVIREEMSAVLRSAYGRGLLSDETFAARLDELFAGHVVDPEAIVGDLHFRGTGGGIIDRVAQTMATISGRLETWFAESDAAPLPVLGLDWSGLESDLIIGRSSHCDVILTDGSVSRRHARLRYGHGLWTLKDLGSMNGTALNGRPVRRCELRPGDVLRLGPWSLRVD